MSFLVNLYFAISVIIGVFTLGIISIATFSKNTMVTDCIKTFVWKYLMKFLTVFLVLGIILNGYVLYLIAV